MELCVNSTIVTDTIMYGDIALELKYYVDIQGETFGDHIHVRCVGDRFNWYEEHFDPNNGFPQEIPGFKKSGWTGRLRNDTVLTVGPDLMNWMQRAHKGAHDFIKRLPPASL